MLFICALFIVPLVFVLFLLLCLVCLFVLISSFTTCVASRLLYHCVRDKQ